MPVVNVSISDLKKGLPVEPGIYKGTIIKYEQGLAKDQASENYVFHIELEDEDKSLVKGTFNSKAMGFTRPFLAAIAGLPEKEWLDQTAKKLKEAGLDNLPFDGDTLVGKTLGLTIIQTPNASGGQPYTNVSGYLPYNAVT